MRARQLDDTERTAMGEVLERIERAVQAIAIELRADVRVERDDRGKFPFVGFRLQGRSANHAPPEPGRDI